MCVYIYIYTYHVLEDKTDKLYVNKLLPLCCIYISLGYTTYEII